MTTGKRRRSPGYRTRACVKCGADAPWNCGRMPANKRAGWRVGIAMTMACEAPRMWRNMCADAQWRSPACGRVRCERQRTPFQSNNRERQRTPYPRAKRARPPQMRMRRIRPRLRDKKMPASAGRNAGVWGGVSRPLGVLLVCRPGAAPRCQPILPRHMRRGNKRGAGSKP